MIISIIENVITTYAAHNRYHPIRAYLDSLTWNGDDFIRKVADCFEENGSDDLPYKLLKRWLIGAVAKIQEQAQNGMLVLEGPQGIGKTTWARWLGSPLPDLYYEGQVSFNDKDTHVRLMSTFVWEFGELNGIIKRADQEALKDFITRRVCIARKPYDKTDTRKFATAALIGTVNDSGGFLYDNTGNRRYLVIPILSIDRAYLDLDVNQLWAQAMALYRAGEQWHLTADEETLQAATNALYEEDDPIEDAIRSQFEITGDPQDFVATITIRNGLKATDIKAGNDKQLTMQIARAMVRIKECRKGRKDNQRGYIGMRERQPKFGRGFGSFSR